MVTFNVLKVCQSRAIIDKFCQDEGFELTYFIETLGNPATHNYASDDDAKEKQFPLLMMHGGGQAALSHTYLKI